MSLLLSLSLRSLHSSLMIKTRVRFVSFSAQNPPPSPSSRINFCDDTVWSGQPVLLCSPSLALATGLPAPLSMGSSHLGALSILSASDSLHCIASSHDLCSKVPFSASPSLTMLTAAFCLALCCPSPPPIPSPLMRVHSIKAELFVC